MQKGDANCVLTLSPLYLCSENHYGQNDPLAPLPDFAIAARRDLDPTAPRTDGAFDAKIVRWRWREREVKEIESARETDRETKRQRH